MLIAVNVAVFAAQLAVPGVTELGLKDNVLIDAGQWWRFLTPAFLHGSIGHLILNMVSLHSLGPLVEWTGGRSRFVAIYLSAAVAGNIVSYFGDSHPSLGASGAIFGLAGCLLVNLSRNRALYDQKYRSLTLRLWLVVGLNFSTGFLFPQIDEWGHLGGLLGGAAAAYLLGPRYELCRVKGEEGVWLVDDPPLEALATPPRRVLK